jgi:hypothetical protein
VTFATVCVHLFELTGRTSVATIHVRLPMPTLKEAVNTMRIGSGSQLGSGDGVSKVGEDIEEDVLSKWK